MKKPKAAPNQAQAEDLSLELKIYSTEHHHKQVRGKLIGKNTAWVVSHGNLVNGSKDCFNFCFFFPQRPSSACMTLYFLKR